MRFNHASLIVVGSVVRVKRRFLAAPGYSAPLSSHFRAGADAGVAARGQAGGYRHEPARHRARASGDCGGYQAMRCGRTRRLGRAGAVDQRRDRARRQWPPTVAGRGQARSLPPLVAIYYPWEVGCFDSTFSFDTWRVHHRLRGS